ncbi:FAD-dependent oxidoreductase [Rhizobium lentis]|uniref:Thioredoxin reductase n=2 Tax=Rhizobium lentis TaxID=1138194 RepID=A0ABS7IA77_9HYPH|nr:FAD-dependent oxidoreductase [Rhizobium lentis]
MLIGMHGFGCHEDFDGGEYLYRVGDRGVDLFFVLEGSVDILENDGRGGHGLVATHEAGEFTGELDHLSGRAVLFCAKANVPTKVLRVSHERFRQLVSAQPEIGDIILRALILRRARLLAFSEGGTVVVGSCRSGDTLRIQTFLERNGYPYRCLDTDDDVDAQEALDTFHVDAASLPIVIVNGIDVLPKPSNRQLAESLGIAEHLNPAQVHDVVVVGAGPSGLAAAVYAASEGLDTMVIEAIGPGGQAGTSSRIENYLGFPMGISGQDLARRAQIQAQKFGARFIVAEAAWRLDCTCDPFALHLDGGSLVLARSVVVATGARYRRLAIPGAQSFEGRGIHYAATPIEANLCAESEVVVVGGGNSAGQAAVFLSGVARHVHLLVRGEGLADTMSDYLVRRIDQSSRITLHTRSEITSLDGEEYLSRVRWRSHGSADVEREISNLFLMIGAVPNTDWLDGCLELDKTGFVKTGFQHDGWSRGTSYATSVPGIFAVGDVRADSVKRVASGVGEGSVVVQSVHRWLASAKEPSAQAAAE